MAKSAQQQKQTKGIVLEDKTKKRSTTRQTKKSKKKRQTQKTKKLWRWKIFKWFLLLFLCGSVFISGYIGYCYLTMPDIMKAVNRTRQPSTVIMAENGKDIAKFGNVYAKVIYPERLPKNLTNAIIATEDKRFYQHHGIDFFGVMRATVKNTIRKRYAQGASTITQQVAKNVFLTQQKTVKRKVQELLLSFWL